MTTRKPGARKQRSIRNHRLLELALADKELNSTAKCVLMVLLFKFQNSKTGLTNPSFERIGDAIGVSRRSIAPAIVSKTRLERASSGVGTANRESCWTKCCSKPQHRGGVRGIPWSLRSTKRFHL
jgi:hypothetical protein